jgi:hypothetical protein
MAVLSGGICAQVYAILRSQLAGAALKFHGQSFEPVGLITICSEKGV